MPLIHFQQRFAEDVETGVKRQTIRLERKRPIKPGDRLILGTWEGKPYRSNVRRLRMEICLEATDIIIGADGCEAAMSINGRRLGWAERTMLARADGFEHCLEMVDWFKKTHGLPFHGVIIRW
jgi:hypothetical protein